MIKIDNLSKSYQDLVVLKDVSLEISSGETLVILGRSGVGKSVFLRHIMGLEKPDSGTVEVNGEVITHLSDHHLYEVIKDMGMLFQANALFDSMSIFENTAFYLSQHYKKISFKEIEERVTHALEIVNLAGTENKMPSQLSGGMRKRAALARLIVYRPKIILYDEPTTGLDPITAMHINELILTTQKELEATSIVVTHDLTSALKVGDRIAILDEGNLAVVVKKEEFLGSQDPIVLSFLNNAIPQGATFNGK